MKAPFILLPIALLCAAQSVSAATVIVSGDTIGAPTYRRVLVGAPPTSLSSIATATPFEETPFSVSADGSYTLLVTSVSPAGWNNFLTLYKDSFDPANALTNVLASSDNFSGGTLNAQITRNLTATTRYFAVVAGSGNANFGSYNLSISGPGDITVGVVPEPASWAMLISGFGLTGAAMRRRRAALA
jgi:hypothetical protein